jgi:hypothetical protein
MNKNLPDILILDPLSMFHRQNENSAQDMSQLMRSLAVIRNRFKLKGTIISHQQCEVHTNPVASQLVYYDVAVTTSKEYRAAT